MTAVKKISHSLVVTLHGVSDTLAITDAADALNFLEAFKMGQPYAKVGTASPYKWINMKQVIQIVDTVTTTIEEVIDATCLVPPADNGEDLSAL